MTVRVVIRDSSARASCGWLCGWLCNRVLLQECRQTGDEAYPIVKTKKSENYDSLLYGRTEIYRRWCPISQCLMLPPLIVAHKALG